MRQVHWRCLQLLGYDDALISLKNQASLHCSKRLHIFPCYDYLHSVSSLPSSQSFMPSHLQVAERHFVLDLHDHWNSSQFSWVTEQFWRGTDGLFYHHLNWHFTISSFAWMFREVFAECCTEIQFEVLVLYLFKVIPFPATLYLYSTAVLPAAILNWRTHEHINNRNKLHFCTTFSIFWCQYFYYECCSDLWPSCGREVQEKKILQDEHILQSYYLSSKSVFSIDSQLFFHP